MAPTDIGFCDPLNQSHTVLVVDYDGVLVPPITRVAAPATYSTPRTDRGREAIVLVRRVPDLIVIDLMMPEVNGPNVVQPLHGDPSTAGIQVMRATAKRVPGQDRQLLDPARGKVLQIIHNPGFNRADFMAKVRRALPRGEKESQMATVLVIEDNPTNMKLTSLILHNAGHSVLRAVDAETGMGLARVEQPDLILMDIQLPGMDGLAATAILKQDPATAGIPVIALSALAMNADAERSMRAGCDAHIVKPLRYNELYVAMERLLLEPPVAAAPNTSGSAPNMTAPAPRPHCQVGSCRRARTARLLAGRCSRERIR
jgi:two-component system cell cycle response regulator DivK